MEDIEITWKWEMTTPFHIGSGFSRAGFADRMVRIDEKGHAVLPPNAVKGAIRGAAEQLSRWLGSQHQETEAESLPKIAVLRRIFAPNETRDFYHFCEGKSHKPIKAYTFSSTKIDPDTRSAQDNTLRTIEVLPRGVVFDGRVQLLGGDWRNRASADYNDALFLASAIAATETVGGKKGVGLGRLRCTDLKIDGRLALAKLTEPGLFALLQHVVMNGEVAA